MDYISARRELLQIWPNRGLKPRVGLRTWLLALVVCWLVCVAWTPISIAAGLGERARFLVIADIHFDPFFDRNLVNRLAGADPRDWPAILATEPGGFSSYGTDTNYRLLESALNDAWKREPDPDFILYPGDFLAHQWRARFNETADDESESAYRQFTAKVVRFLAHQFARYFPNVPVLPTLGNEDAYCGDYQIQPNGPFLGMFTETWRPLLGPVPSGQTDFDAAFPRGGYFSMPLPQLEKHRLIVLNTIFFSPDYTNRCGVAADNPASEQLEWLRRTLEKARLQRESVWLLMHIPFGIDVFNTLRTQVARPRTPVPFWRPEYSASFFGLLRRRGSLVQAMFSGHLHMDTFRIISGPGRAIGFNHIAPAVSPIFGNNPGYQLFSYVRETGELADYATFYLTNLSGAGKARARGIWAREYEFNRAYGLDGVNRATLTTLSRQVARNPEVRRKYARYYDVSHTGARVISERNVSAYRCALENITARAFERCRHQ